MSTTDSPDAAVPDEVDATTPARGLPAQGAAPAVEQTPPAGQPTQIVVTAPNLGFLTTPAIAGAAAYGAMLLVAIIAGVVASSATTDSGAVPDGASSTLPFLLTGMAMFGPLRAGGSANEGLASAYGQITLVPLSLTLVGLAAAWLVTSLRAVPSLTTRNRWRDSVAAGAILGVIGAVVAGVAKITWAADFDLLSADASIGVKPFEVLFGGFVVGALGAALGYATAGGRLDLGRLGIRVPALVGRSIANVATGTVAAAGIGSVVALVAGLVKIGFAGTVGLFLTVLPNALAYVATIGGLGSLTLTGDLASDGDNTLSLFTDDVPGALWLTLVLVVIAVLVAAVRGLLASGQRDWRGAWVTPVVLAAASVVTILATKVSVSGAGDLGLIGSGAGGGSLQIAWVTVVIAAVWGLVIEVAERYAAPVVVALVPGLPGLYARVTKQDPAITGATLAGTDGSSAPRSVDSRKAKIIGLGVLGAAVLIGGAVGARTVVQNVVFTPATPVEQYVAALEAGDVERAFSLADPDLPNAQRTLLTNELYADVEGRPTGAKVTKVTTEGDSAFVTVQAKQDGSTVTQQFTLSKSGRQYLVFDRWELDPPQVPSFDASMVLPMDADELLVNGTAVARESVSVLPGTYTLALSVPADAEGLLESPQVTVTVFPDGSVDGLAGSSFLTYDLTEEAVAAAEEQASQLLAECLASTVLDVEDCNLDVYDWRADEAVNVAWSSDGEPTFETSSFDLYSLTLYVTGTANVTYDLPAAEYWEAEPGQSDSDDYWFEVSYGFSGGELHLAGLNGQSFGD